MTTTPTSLKQCVENISAKNTDYKFPEQAINQVESLKSLSSDLYTDNIRFIYELIQNADDAQAKNIILKILGNEYFIITHDGKIFDEKDLQGLCGINNGTKKKDLDKTGYKGLGFKSVFGKSDYVMIYSNGEYFRFDSSHKIQWNKQWETNDQQTWENENDRQFIYPWQINPIWTNENQVPQLIKDFLNSKKEEINVANIIALNNIQEIHSAIDQLKQQPYMFLFLRNISKMTFLTQTNDIISIARHLSYGLKQVYFNKNIDSQWIIKRIKLDVPIDVRNKLADDTKAPDKLRLLKKAEIFFAAKYKDKKLDDNGGIEKLHGQDSILFSYLPTKILEYKFPILINANFLTNVNREQIHTDSPWNQWLFDRIGWEIFQWIKKLVKNKKFGFQAYRLIPSKLTLINNILSIGFNKSFEKSIRNCNFILNRQNQLLKVNEVIMDSTSMSQQSSFININSMRQYIINNERNHSEFVDYPFIDYDLNLKQIGVKEFTWDQCIDMFKSNIFLQTYSPDQNKRMIEYFYKKFSNLEVTIELEFHIEQIPFLLDQNNCLQLTKDIYFPAETIGDSGTQDSNDSFINKIIFHWLNEYTQKDIKQWLEKLGITERTDLTYLYKTIIPNVSIYITYDNAIKTIETLFTLFQKRNIEKKELNELRKLKLLTTRGTLIPAEQCFFSDQYKSGVLLEEYLKIEEDKFLSFDYVQKENDDLAEWRRFFTMLGVQGDLHPIIFNRKLTYYEATGYGFCEEYLLRASPDGKHTIDAFSGLITITFMQYTQNNYNFANFFWSHLIGHVEAEVLKKDVRVYWGHSNRRGAIDGTLITDANYINWFVKNIKCVPTTTKTCELASNIFVYNKELENLCGQYMCFSSILLPQDKKNWHSIFNFKTKLFANDYFDLLEKIRCDEKNLKNNLDRIQMIYSHILKEMFKWSCGEREIMKKRANSVYLLTENDQWKSAQDLFFYMEGSGINNNMNDAIPCLKLDYDNRNELNLTQFLELLNIKQIRMNDLKLADECSSHAEDFRRKLIDISPFLKKWLENSSASSDIISMIDKKIQQENEFIESNRLQLFYNKNFVQETNVYFDTQHKQLYVRRPWNSETTFIDLPNKLCQLLNIRGFEQNIRFLLKGTIEEIKNHFNTNSIEIPTQEDIIILESSSKPADFEHQLKPSSAPVSESKTSVTSLSVSKKPDPFLNNRETRSNKHENTARTAKVSLDNPDTVLHLQQSYPSYPYNYQLPTYAPIQEMNPSISSNFIQSKCEQFSSMELIDVSSITTSNLVLFQNLFDGTGDGECLDLITGRIGEEMVYRHLLNKYRDQLNSVYIVWENQQGESYSPYDISLTINGKTQHIEVKSTRTYNQHIFPLSINQIESFLRHKENYFIYRVYIDENQFIILDNIRWRLIQKQQLACFLRILPISSN